MGRRLFACCVVLVSGVDSLCAQGVSLAENKKNVYFRVHMQTNVTGVMKLRQDAKDVSLNVQVIATHVFSERVLETDAFGVKRTARNYQDAAAVFTVGKDRLERKLRISHRLVAAHRVQNQTIAYCPKGPFTREELELTEHLDTLALPGLLPNEKKSIGDSWRISNAVVQSLCSLDGLTGHDVHAKLDKATESTATISLSGTVNGIDLGAAVKLSVDGELNFDRNRECITSVIWKQDDDREQGPANPALTAKGSIVLKRQPVKAVKELGDFALVPIPSDAVPPKRLTELIHEDAAGRFTLKHERGWHLVAQTEKHIVFRLMDRGDFVAQATLSPWKKAKPGEHTSAADFRDAMEQFPGWELEQTLDKGSEIESKKGHWVYRVGASGKLEGVDAVQYFYLTAGPRGDQIIVTFTMTPTQSQKLNTRDVEFVRSLTIHGK